MDAEQNSRGQRPLSAAEIGHLCKMEKKATKGKWTWLRNLRSGYTQVMSKFGEVARVSSVNDDDAALIAAMRNALPRLLSMLQPPTAAEVELNAYRSAIAAKTKAASIGEGANTRAVRSPGLTEEQEEAVRWAQGFIAQYGFKASAWIDERDSQRESEEMEFDMCSGLEHLRAAFPGVFGKEG